MYAPTWPTLSAGSLLGAPARPSAADALAGAAGLFAYARDAIDAGLAALGLRAGDGILVPAYTCDAVVAPMARRGLRILYYGLEGDLGPRLADLRAGAGAARALYVIDYFGVIKTIVG